MKKAYYATCMPGLERAVEARLRREPGVVVEWSGEGAVMFRADKAPNLSYLHNVFLVLQTLSGLPDLDEAVKKLLLAGDWLDRMPFAQLEGKRFRIVTMHGEQLVPVNMRYLDLLEQVICEHTGMRVLRERPDVELWLIRRGERVTVFGWRLTSHRAAKGQNSGVRADLCAMMAWLARAGAGATLRVGRDAEGRMDKAARAEGAARVVALEELQEQAPVGDASVRAVIGAPYWIGKGETSTPAVRALLQEVQRVLAPEGRAALLMPEGALGGALEQVSGLEAMDRFSLRIGGRTLHLWLLTAVDPAQESAMED